MAALIDTNVILDALGNRQPWAKAAQDLLFLASQGKAHLYVSGSTVTDIYYLANRHVYHDRARSKQIVGILLDSLSVAEVGFGDCLYAIGSSVSDYEDAVVAEAARRAGLDCIVTRNRADFAHADVPTMLPEEYLATIVSAEPA